MNFYKMQGLGNDYIYIDCTKGKNTISNPNKLAIALSNRHFGIGSDGLILIQDSKIADFRMKMYNQDGTEAQMCGNGIRCVGKLVYEQGLTNKEVITIETLAGVKKLKLNINKGNVESIQVNMGKPLIKNKKLIINALEKKFELTYISMGNPHAVTFVKDLDSFPINKYGPILEVAKQFPERANIEFVEVIDEEHLKMRVWERGTGETLACGTGACATVVASNLMNFTTSNVEVSLLGGNLQIDWNKNSNTILMTGPAEFVFKGKIYFNN